MKSKKKLYKTCTPILFFRIFDVVCECLIDYEQIMKDSHEIS